MTTPIPIAAIAATAPTSRATFRLLARAIDATNRDADTLRHALLAQWAEHASGDELVRRLRRLDQADPDASLGVEARLAVWFAFADPGSGGLIAADDSLLTGVSEEFRHRLAGTARPPTTD
ncbi:MAG: hypothetical protein AB8G26_06505 [Ilumatobacter sp.]